MISLIFGILTLTKISAYKKSRRFVDAKSAGTLGTVNLVFTIIQLLPSLVVALTMLGSVGEMVEEANGNIDVIIVSLIAGGIMLAPMIILTIFGFYTASKGRKLWKSVNTYGSPDYVPVDERNTANTYSGYGQNQGSYSYGQNQSGYGQNQSGYGQNQSGYGQNQGSYNYGYSGNTVSQPSGSNNSGFYNSSGLYPQNNTQNTTVGTQTVSNTPSSDTSLPQPVDFSAEASTPATSNDCVYGRSDMGYIPHPEATEAPCTTHDDSFGKKKWKCPSCNKTNKAEETFCRNCGTNRTANF
ncbi:MAG: hypothetical protein IJZ51_09065 [Ruminiclostridium sp.]|nr:hypothetical protein [Ruminiclostridium sp.]